MNDQNTWGDVKLFFGGTELKGVESLQVWTKPMADMGYSDGTNKVKYSGKIVVKKSIIHRFAQAGKNRYAVKRLKRPKRLNKIVLYKLNLN